MSWRDRYHQASFKGFDLFVDSATLSGGQRIVKHTYPKVDGAEFEDLGVNPLVVTLNAYVSGTDYDYTLENVIQALNVRGAGRLVVPYRSYDYVATCEGFQVTENVMEGGMARLSLTFAIERAQDIPFLPTLSVPDATSALKVAKDSAYLSMRAKFIEGYVENPLFKKAVNRVEAVVDALDDAVNAVQDAKLLFAPVEEFNRLASTIRGKLIAIALGTEDFINEFEKIIDFGTDSEDASQPTEDEALTAFRDFLKSATLYDIDTTELDLRIVNTMLASMVVSSASTAMQFIPLTTTIQATEIRDLFMEQLTRVEGSLDTSDDMYAAFRDMRKAVVNYLNSVSDSLLDARTIVLVETTPALVLSNVLYGNIDNEQNIIDRNSVQHPMFVPGGQELSVVDDG